MQNQAAKLSSVPNYPTFLLNQKALGADNANSGQVQQNQSQNLGQWLEDARAYYNEVMSGQAPQPSPQEWNQFMTWMNWASQQMGPVGGGWDPRQMPGGGGMGGTPQVNNYGGELGPEGSYTYDMVSTKLGFTGPETRNDVFGTDNELNIEQASGSVTCEETMDKGVPVLKVSVKTAKGTAVYLYDNYKNPDFKLKINVPFVDKVTGGDKFPGKITVGKFDPKAVPGAATAESSLAGVEDPKNPGTFTYKPKIDEDPMVDFKSLPGKTEKHILWADANITIQNGDSANATLDAATGDLTVVVTHPEDGTTDTYILKKGFNVQLNNIKKEYLTFGNPPVASTGTVPDSYKDRMKVDGLAAAGGAAAAGAVTTGKGAEVDTKVKNFIGAFTNPTVTFDDIKNAGLVDEIAFSKGKPSYTLLKFIQDHDQNMQYQKSQHNGQARVQRLQHFLNALGYTTGTTAPAGYKVIFPQLLITIGGTPYYLVEEGLGSPETIRLADVPRDD